MTATKHRMVRRVVVRLHAVQYGDTSWQEIAELLLDLEREALFDQRVAGVLFEDERVVDLGHVLARELDVDDGADGLDDGALCLCHGVFLKGQYGFL